jgi:chemotaxis protein CheD
VELALVVDQKAVTLACPRSVSIGEVVVSGAAEDILAAYGVGSCVVVCLYDAEEQLGGMLHALLPVSIRNGAAESPKYVTQGIPLLVDALLDLGAKCSRLVAHLGGGAQILNRPGMETRQPIGKRNVQTAELTLEMMGIPVVGRATGGTVGRTVRLYVKDGLVTVRSVGKQEEPI